MSFGTGNIRSGDRVVLERPVKGHIQFLATTPATVAGVPVEQGDLVTVTERLSGLVMSVQFLADTVELRLDNGQTRSVGAEAWNLVSCESAAREEDYPVGTVVIYEWKEGGESFRHVHGPSGWYVQYPGTPFEIGRRTWPQVKVEMRGAGSEGSGVRKPRILR